MAHLQILKKAAASAAEKKAAVLTAAAEAKARRERAEALRAEADELRSGLKELSRLARFLGPAELEAQVQAEARLAEIEADPGYQALVAEIEAAEAEAARRAMEADLARREAERKARREAQAQKEMSKDIFRWVRATGPNRLAVVVSWAGPGLAKAAVRLERDENGGRPVIRVSSVRGQTRSFRSGQTWAAAWSSLPMALRKGCQKAGWVQAPKA